MDDFNTNEDVIEGCSFKSSPYSDDVDEFENLEVKIEDMDITEEFIDESGSHDRKEYTVKSEYDHINCLSPQLDEGKSRSPEVREVNRQETNSSKICDHSSIIRNTIEEHKDISAKRVLHKCGNHKTNPVYLEDSMDSPAHSASAPADSATTLAILDNMEMEKEEENTFVATPSSPTSKDPCKRFSRNHRRVAPFCKYDLLIKEMKKAREIRRNEFNIIREHLKKTEEQRERFLNIVENFYRARKRPRLE